VTARISAWTMGIAAACALAACASLPGRPLAPSPALAAAAGAPRPAEGLWAILDPGCAKPSLADPRKWPRCASPFWISRNSALVVRSKPATGPASYRADFRLAAGDPMIAQVGNHKDGYLFLALTKLDRDGQGRLVAATGAAIACNRTGVEYLFAEPNQGGCERQTPAFVHQAAQETLKDPAALTRVAWIAGGAPEGLPAAGVE
jgi:hypothetical protein